MKKEKFKLSKPYYFKGCEMIDILKRKSFLGIKYWSYHDSILNNGQTEEVVFLLNNPDEAKKRIKESIKLVYNKKALNKQGF